MALVIHTSLGAHYWGVLHLTNGQLARFPSRETCEAMAEAVLQKARAQHAAGKLDPAILRVELHCYAPTSV